MCIEKKDPNLHGVSVDEKIGIMKSMESRRKLLERTHHSVRFVFTPKHCSWLNPIENWFAKLQKHIIKNGSFTSVSDLEAKISNYIKFHNDDLAKVIKWKFKGFTKKKVLQNIIYHKLAG